jgi:uncharacterized membrane protein YeaQ/YmgE (transglycosylase-associated protein family)
MNLMVGIVAGAIIGWVAFSILRSNIGRGLRTSLFIGIGGGALGAQLAPMLSAGVGIDGQFHLFSVVTSVAVATGALIVANMLAGGRGS